MKKKCIAVILAAGQGKRMGTQIRKQYLELCSRPVLCYTVKAFEQSDIIDEIILVTEKGKKNMYGQKLLANTVCIKFPKS